jgi:hypothetical protein
LELLRKNFKDFLCYDGWGNIKILDPCMDIRSMTDNEVWGLDPIHPTGAVYTKIAASVIKISSNLVVNIAKRNRTDSMEAGTRSGPDARHGRRESGSRADWDKYRSDPVPVGPEVAEAAEAKEDREEDALTTKRPCQEV